MVEVRTLDSRRKLVLLRRDGIEHLVLLGPNQDLHLEGGIAAPREAAHPVSLATAPEAPEAPEARVATKSAPTKLPSAERRSS